MAKKPARKTAQKPAQKAALKPGVLITRWWAPKTFGLALARWVMSYRRRYDKGERVYVLHALDACLNNGYLPEPWMLKGLWDAVTALEDGADPNEAFGYVRPKGKHIDTNRAKNRKRMQILFYVYDLHCNQGLALDDSGAFAVAAEEFACSARDIRRIHDAAPAGLKFLLKGVRKARPDDVAGLDD
jgi:hypothetical protein